MNRRQFVSGSLGSALAIAGGAVTSRATTASVGRDVYGGWTGRTFKPTGFFRLEKRDRWWLVTPEGNAFLIHAIDHCGPAPMYQSYNADYWLKRMGLSEDASYTERAKAFYEKKMAEDKTYLGFNCLYSHTMPRGLKMIPYIPRAQTLHNEYWRIRREDWSDDNFLDVFSRSFIEQCEASAARMVNQGRAEDPYVLAHALTDSPVLDRIMAMPHRAGFFHKPMSGSITWPVRLRNLGPGHAGKQAYVELMRKRYGSVKTFNGAYNTDFASWETLVNTASWRPRVDGTGNLNEEADNQAFLLQILDKAWSTQVATIRAHDENHLIFGDTLNFNTPITDDIIRVYAKHFPVILYQYYGATWADHEQVIERIARVTGKPMFSADSSWSVKDAPRMPDPLGPQCANWEIGAQRMTEVYKKAFERTDFIGWGWCGWMDKWESAEPHMQHGGLQDAFGKWHQPIADAYAQFGKDMYTIATSKR